MVPGFPVSLFERIAQVMDCELLIDSERSGPAPGTDPFADGTADFGWICSTSFVARSARFRTGSSNKSAAGVDSSISLAGVAWVPSDSGSAGQPVYFGDVVVQHDSPHRSLADLADSRVGCNDEVSLSGHYAFRLAVHEAGYDPDTFADLCFTGGHHRSLDMVLAGDLDAATVDSVVRFSRAARDPAVDALRVVERLGPWPVQPLVVRSDLDPEIVQHCVQALVDSNNDPAMQRELEAASLSHFVPVTEDHYRDIAASLARIIG